MKIYKDFRASLPEIARPYLDKLYDAIKDRLSSELDVPPVPTPDEPVTPPIEPVPDPTPPITSLSGVKWIHANVSGWPITGKLTVSVTPSKITLNYPQIWPVCTINGTEVVGNPIAVFFCNGVLVAATWEWLRPGQYVKEASAVGGHKIKNSFVPATWKPKSGERIGFMVASCGARPGAVGTQVQERTDVVWVTWP